MIQSVRKVCVGITVLVAGLAAREAQCGPTHPFSTSDSGLPGLTRVLGGISDYPVLLYVTGPVKGFSRDAAVQVQVNRTDAGDFEGFFNAFRSYGNKRARNAGTDNLIGTVSGTAYDFGEGIMYLGVATITRGTGRLEGATGSILIMITQYGYQDPNTILVDRDADFVYDGEYTLP